MTTHAQSKRRPVEKAAPTGFKRIDLAFLNLARRRVIPVTRGTGRADVELVLPAWGVTGYPHGTRVLIRNVGVHPWIESSSELRRQDYAALILRNSAWANEQALTRLFGDRPENRSSVERFTLVAECPPPPVEVLKSVERVASKFDEIFIAFEADWREDVSVVLDPLVIGVKTRTEKREEKGYKGEFVERTYTYDVAAYLLAVYDPTKLEHYIASEFTTL